MAKNATSFKKGDPRINRKGAPKRDWTWSSLLAQVAEEIEPKSGKPFKELVSKRIWLKAANGDTVAIKAVFNRMDGMPPQAIEQKIEGKFIIDIDEVLRPRTPAGKTKDSTDDPSGSKV